MNEHIAENESVFRAVNESVAADVEAYNAETGRYGFLCECSNDACFERIWLSIEEYEAVREEGRRFVVIPEHVVPEVETVVHQTDDYAVVEKRGGTGAVAEELDPRP